MTTYKDFGETAEYYGWGAVPDAWGAMGDAMAAPGSALLDLLGKAVTKAGYGPTAPTPGSDQLTASEMDREQGWARGGPDAYGPSAAGALGAAPAPGTPAPAWSIPVGREPTGDFLTDAYLDWQDDDFGIWGRVGNWLIDRGGNVADVAGGAADLFQAADAGFDPLRDAAGLLAQGDLSGAIGAYAGGTADQLGDFYTEGLVPASEAAADAQAWLERELGETATNFGQNLYSNWGLQDLLQAADQQAMKFGQWSSEKFDDLEALKDRVLSEAGEFVTDQAVPYFLEGDFVEDVTNLGQGVAGQATDTYQDHIFPFYEENIAPLVGEVADLATDVYGEYLYPFYEGIVEPAGLAVADFATDTAFPWMIDEALPYLYGDLRHDVSDVLEMIPASLRGLLPEGSRADAALEAAVGGIDTAFEAVTETAPAAVGDFVNRGIGWLFDPSQPGFGGDGGGDEVAEVTQADVDAYLRALDAQQTGTDVGVDTGAGAGAPAADPEAAADPAVSPAGPMVTYPGGEAGAGPLMSPQEVAEQIYDAAQGRGGGGLSDLYADMYGAQRTWAQDAYDAQMRGAAAAGQAGQDYAATVLQQGEQAAIQAEAAANQYYTEGADEAAREYNETVGALNNREQELIRQYAELAAVEASGAASTATEQRRVAAELQALQTQRTSLRHGLIMEGLTEEEARRTTRLGDFETTREGRLASDEAALIQMISGLETGRVGQEQAMAEQLAARFTGARAGMQQRIDAAEATLREQGIEPAAYTAAPGAETQALLTSQELSMQTLQNRLRDASAAQAIDRQMRGSEIYSAAGRALEDNLFAMRAQLEDSIAQRKGIANLDTFDRQADIDIAGAAERGEINLQELAALQASKEAMFGRKTDLFAESELNRIYTRSDYNAALATERAARQRALEAAQQQRIIAQAAAAQQAFAGQQSRLQREHEAAISAKETAAAIAQAEAATEIAQIEAAAAEAQRLSEDYLMVNVDGVDIPVDRDWYVEEHLIGPGAGSGSDLASDVNLMKMEDSAGNQFFVDVGGVDESGTPYLTSSAATNPQLTGGNVLTTVYEE
jgi:hypothetical protein